jgi:hypothetical protein
MGYEDNRSCRGTEKDFGSLAGRGRESWRAIIGGLGGYLHPSGRDGGTGTGVRIPLESVVHSFAPALLTPSWPASFSLLATSLHHSA